jgi:patatin-like phospholipase/acyl hydrolase
VEPLRVLAIDGGGIRGVIPARVLVALEEAASVPACELFDLIVGTSTGGLLALGLTAPAASSARSAEQLRAIYRDEGKVIFPGRMSARFGAWGTFTTAIGGPTAGAAGWVKQLRQRLNLKDEGNARHSPGGLESVLSRLLGETRLSEAKPDVVITSYDLVSRAPVLFSSAQARSDPTQDVLLRDVARATSAAPTYFPPLELQWKGARHILIDGGVVANNPTAVALAEALERTDRNRPIVLVSLGTGRADPQPAESVQLDVVSTRSWLVAAQDIMQILFDGTSELTDQLMQSLTHDLSAALTYARFQTTMHGVDQAMDAPANFEALDSLGEALITDRAQEIHDLAALLTPR